MPKTDPLPPIPTGISPRTREVNFSSGVSAPEREPQLEATAATGPIDLSEMRIARAFALLTGGRQKEIRKPELCALLQMLGLRVRAEQFAAMAAHAMRAAEPASDGGMGATLDLIDVQQLLDAYKGGEVIGIRSTVPFTETYQDARRWGRVDPELLLGGPGGGRPSSLPPHWSTEKPSEAAAKKGDKDGGGDGGGGDGGGGGARTSMAASQAARHAEELDEKLNQETCGQKCHRRAFVLTCEPYGGTDALVRVYVKLSLAAYALIASLYTQREACERDLYLLLQIFCIMLPTSAALQLLSSGLRLNRSEQQLRRSPLAAGTCQIVLITLSALLSGGLLVVGVTGLTWLQQSQGLDEAGAPRCTKLLWELTAGLVYTVFGLAAYSLLLLLPRSAYLSRRKARLATYEDVGSRLGDTV